MATSLLTHLNLFLKVVSKSHPIGTAILGAFSCIHAVYAYSTADTKVITIKQSYDYVTHGTTRLMVVDNDGQHYKMSNSLWYWKWDTLEDVATHRKLGNHMDVKYYGIRIPMLGMFPSIYSTKIGLPPKKIDKYNP